MKNDNEELKEKNVGKIFPILLIFGIVIGFIFILPDIYQKYSKEGDRTYGSTKPNESDGDSTKTENDKSPMSDYYQIGNNGKLTYNELVITDIALSNEKVLEMTINADDDVDLDELEYYVEFYDDRTTFLGRRALHGKVTKALKITLDVSNLPVTTTTFMTISHITTSSIEPIKMTTDESGLSSLSCRNEMTSYEYVYNLKNLSKITRKYTYTNSNKDEFAKAILEAEKKAKEYNDFIGVTARVIDDRESFIFLSEFDYETGNSFEKVGDEYIFAKNTPNSVLKFKMEAEGFECE